MDSRLPRMFLQFCVNQSLAHRGVSHWFHTSNQSLGSRTKQLEDTWSSDCCLWQSLGSALQANACFRSKRLLEALNQAIAIDSNRLPRCPPIAWFLNQAIGCWCEANGLLLCEQAIGSHKIVETFLEVGNPCFSACFPTWRIS